jgi:hypothetical protein
MRVEKQENKSCMRVPDWKTLSKFEPVDERQRELAVV